MPRFWTCHWQFRYWRPETNGEGRPVRSSGSNSFRKRGVSNGDFIYIISLGAGQLYLGGRMVVDGIISRPEAVRLWNNDRLYPAEEWLVDRDDSGTMLHLHRRLSPELTKQLRFVSSSGPKEAFFVNDTDLDKQATRGLRELARESAELLDRIIDVTDRLPRTGKLITVSGEFLNDPTTAAESLEFRSPEEVPGGTAYAEGSVRRVEVNRYERDPRARSACIEAHGTICCICGFSFGAIYGPKAEGYIHVHHTRPLSEVGDEYAVDPIEELRPVCPNCHAVLHLGGRSRTIEEVRGLVEASRLTRDSG